MSEISGLDPRARIYRADATLWVWIAYGLAQATITMLMAFDVIKTLTASEVCTAVALIIYVAVNEVLVRPGWRRRSGDGKDGSTDKGLRSRQVNGTPGAGTPEHSAGPPVHDWPPMDEAQHPIHDQGKA